MMMMLLVVVMFAYVVSKRTRTSSKKGTAASCLHDPTTTTDCSSGASEVPSNYFPINFDWWKVKIIRWRRRFLPPPGDQVKIPVYVLSTPVRTTNRPIIIISHRIRQNRNYRQAHFRILGWKFRYRPGLIARANNKRRHSAVMWKSSSKRRS